MKSKPVLEKSDLRGFLVSVPMSWDEEGRLDETGFKGAIARLIERGCDGMYLFGTSGEGYSLTDREFEQCVQVFARETSSFAGFRQVCCFGLSVAQVCERCGIVRDNGIEGVQVTLPFWKELTNSEVTAFFNRVCSSFPSISFLLYNNPRNKRRLNGRELAELGASTDNFHAVKTGSGAWLDFFDLLSEAPLLRHFVTEAPYFFAQPLGAAGLIPSSNYAWPHRCRAYHEAIQRGDVASAQKMQREIVSFFHATAVPLLQKGYIDGAIDKAYARIGGMDIKSHMRAPYQPLSPADQAWLEETIRRRFPDLDAGNHAGQAS